MSMGKRQRVMSFCGTKNVLLFVLGWCMLLSSRDGEDIHELVLFGSKKSALLNLQLKFKCNKIRS